MTRDRRSSRTIDVVYRFDPDRPSRRRAPRSPSEAQAKLTKGNRSFAHLLDSPGSARVIPLDPSDVGHGLEPGVAPVQRPFAAVLGCSDARVPIETVFQQKSNDLFVVRVAGNGVGIGGLGSLRHAVGHFHGSLRLIVVLGHSQCGAVTAAVDVFLRPALYLPLAANYPLRSIVDAILVAVRTASLALKAVHGPHVAARPGYRAALIETAVAINACVAAFGLKQELESRRCRVLFGTYDLASRYVRLALTPEGRKTRRGSALFRLRTTTPRSTASPPRSPAARASPPSCARERARAGAELAGRAPLAGRRRPVCESARRRVGNGNQHRADEQGRARVRAPGSATGTRSRAGCPRARGWPRRRERCARGDRGLAAEEERVEVGAPPPYRVRMTMTGPQAVSRMLPIA